MSNVNINKRTSVHAGSGGTVTSPDVCKTPRRCRPQVYSNVAKSSDSTKTASSVKVNGNSACNKDSNFAVSRGDEPGTCGGNASGTIKQKAEFITFSANVSIEGSPAVRNADLMTSNNKNTPPMPVIQPGAGSAAKISPPSVGGIEQNNYPNKLVSVLIANKQPIGINGVITTIDKSRTVSYKTNLGSAENIGKDATGQTRWALTQLNVPSQQYHAFLSFVDGGQGLNKKQIDLLSKKIYPDSEDQYHIPLSIISSINSDKKVDYSDIELMPVYPARLLQNDKNICAPLRNGWLYIYLNGFLWREIYVDGQKNEFSDVNITKYQGMNERPATVQAQNNILLLPRALKNKSGPEVVDVQFCFSEEQWSWSYIDRIGGLNDTDCRFLPELNIYKQRKEENKVVDVNKKAQENRLQITQLTSFSPLKKNSSSARKNYLIHLETAINENKLHSNKNNLKAFQFNNYSVDDVATNLPVLVFYDAIGEAREKALAYHSSLLIMKYLMKDLSGNYTENELKRLNPYEKREIERQVVKYKMACVLHQYLYQGVEVKTPSNLTDDEIQDFENSINDRKNVRQNHLDESAFLKFTKQNERKKINDESAKLKNSLVRFIDDRDNPFNFSIAMQDMFSLEDDKYYLNAMQCMGEICKDLLKSSRFLDSHISDNPINQLDFMQNDSGVKFVLNLLNSGKNVHPLHFCMFAEDCSPSDEESSLYDYISTTTKSGESRFNGNNLLLSFKSLDNKYQGDEVQVARRAGEALGAWTEINANLVFSLLTAQKIIKESQLKVSNEGVITTEQKKASELKSKYRALSRNIKKWKVILNHLMRVHYISNIIPFEAVRIPPETVARGPYPKGYFPMELDIKKMHAATKVAVIEKALRSKSLKIGITNQFGDLLGSHALKDVLNIDASLSAIHDLAEDSGQIKPAYKSTFVEVFLYREDKVQLKRKLSADEVNVLLKEKLTELDDLSKRLGLKSDELARNKLISEIDVWPKIRKEVLMRKGYNMIAMPVLFAVNVWNLSSMYQAYQGKKSTRALIDFDATLLDMAAVSAEVARVISTQIHGYPSRAHMNLARKHGMSVVFQGSVSKKLLLLIGAGILNIAASTVTTGISLYDVTAAISIGDSGAAMGHAFVASGAMLSATAAWMAMPWVGGALVGLSATGIGLLAVALILVGVAIIWFFRDKPIETWLKNCAWGKSSTIAQYQFDSKAKKYKLVRTPLSPQRYGGRSEFIYKANKIPIFDWIIPDNEFVAWEMKPELAFQRLMDIINRPHIQFKEREANSNEIVLQVFNQGYQLGISEQELELEYSKLDFYGRLDLSSPIDKGGDYKGVNLSDFWSNTKIRLITNPFNRNQVNGLEIKITKQWFVDNMPKELQTLNFVAKLRHWPNGKNKTLSPSISIPYSLPDPERDDDGNIKNAKDLYLRAETEMRLRYIGRRARRKSKIN